jgi:hypothetical protein
MQDYEVIIKKIDRKLGDGEVFQGVLAEEIAKYHLKGKSRIEVMRYYAQVYGVSQLALNKQVKNME